MVRERDSGESTHEVVPLREAIEAARAMGLDLVEVNGKASPPVCRAMDYERVRYDQKKRVKEQKKASAAAKRRDVIKELRLTAKIDAHDLNVKINGARKFLNAGHRVTLEFCLKSRTASRSRSVRSEGRRSWTALWGCWTTSRSS